MNKDEVKCCKESYGTLINLPSDILVNIAFLLSLSLYFFNHVQCIGEHFGPEFAILQIPGLTAILCL